MERDGWVGGLRVCRMIVHMRAKRREDEVGQDEGQLIDGS